MGAGLPNVGESYPLRLRCFVTSVGKLPFGDLLLRRGFPSRPQILMMGGVGGNLFRLPPLGVALLWFRQAENCPCLWGIAVETTN